jgi:hypothetical protein
MYGKRTSTKLSKSFEVFFPEAECRRCEGNRKVLGSAPAIPPSFFSRKGVGQVTNKSDCGFYIS